MTTDIPVVQALGDYAPVPHAAEVAGVSTRTMKRAIADGRVRAVRLAGYGREDRPAVLVSLRSARALRPLRTRRGATETGAAGASDSGGERS